jgi:replicative DNA helicase
MAINKQLLDTERAVLAVLLNDSHAIIPVMGVIDDGAAFSDPAHTAIYDTILALTKARIVPNIHTVCDKHPGLSTEKLQDIARVFNTKTSKEVLYLADIVAREGRRRRVLAAMDEARSMVQAEADIEGASMLAMQMVATAADSRLERDPAIAEVNKRLDTEIAQLANGDVIGFPTGLEWLDDKTGGLQPAHVWIISAPYKGRKTTLARNIIKTACRKGASVDMFALEGDQGSTSLGLQAMVATELLSESDRNLSETFVKRGWPTVVQKAAIDAARHEIDGWNLRIYDGRDGIGTADKIVAKVKRDRVLFGLNIFIVDYLQLLGSGKLFERVEASTHALQRLIVEEGVTGVLLAQLNEQTIRDGDSDYSPGVKGGGDPAAAADFLLRTIYDGENRPDRLTVHLKLARHAQPGKQEYIINPQSGLIVKPAK